MLLLVSLQWDSATGANRRWLQQEPEAGISVAFIGEATGPARLIVVDHAFRVYVQDGVPWYLLHSQNFERPDLSSSTPPSTWGILPAATRTPGSNTPPLPPFRLTYPRPQPGHRGVMCWHLGKFEHLRLSPDWDGTSAPLPHIGQRGLIPSLTVTSGQLFINSFTNGAVLLDWEAGSFMSIGSRDLSGGTTEPEVSASRCALYPPSW